ncbi:hypothetical protein [Haliangium ochraceum]|uniref:ABM domain-containing protein n=1 Tax=Haliangium ochraceum (strain DSM 14365 / JCM 11303 / SMP-2) TaxID=502025 RepID=D0LMC2_HALO1|nr:hypothetical protein [Haliangium ochraceum]ACY16828.1 hypothetical protein Hoch_4333 [Haliangium ochraceum DSM 14365]
MNIRSTALPVLASLFLLPACGDTDPASDIDPAIAARFACDEVDFAPMPFQGPGVDPETGAFASLDNETYVVHTTHLLLKPGMAEKVYELSGPILADLMSRPGFVAVSLATSDTCGSVRTLGVWESEVAMYDFVFGEAHTAAMDQTTEVSESGRVTHWTLSADDVKSLTWDQARAEVAEVPPAGRYE